MENTKRPDGRTYFMNKQTGEVILSVSKFTAFLNFIVDGKKHGYKVNFDDVVEADGK